MKKKLIITLVVVSMLVCILAACGGNKTPDCSHNWEDTSTTATCDTAGLTTQTCSLCGDTQEVSAPALGHDMERTETVKATCQSGGYDIYTCKNEGCDKTEERNKTNPDYSPAGHTFEPDTQDPTCTKSGHTDNTCIYCGSSDGTRETIPALKHTYQRDDYDGVTGKTVTAPTCEENGSITYACQDCDYEETFTYEQLVEAGKTELADEVKAIGHDMVPNTEKTTAPTCEEVGSNWLICANGCGKEEQIADTPALGHTYTRDNVGTADFNYKTVLAPTCITEGYEWVICDDCGYCTAEDETPDIDTYRKTILAHGNHVFDVKGETTAPTCTEKGYTTYGCSADEGCVATEDRDEVKALDHDWVLTTDLLLNGTTPTCKTNGDYPYHCSRCSETSVNEGGEQNNGARHEGYTAGDFTGGIAPTCISRGSYYCEDCKTVFLAYEGDTLADAHGNHVFDVAGDVTPSTCSEYGYTTYGCSADEKCTATENRDYTARAAHQFGDRSEDGSIVCYHCSEEYIDETTIIAQDSKELCDHDEGETCETCGIGVIITGTKTPDPAYALTANTLFTNEFINGAALIELKGEAGTTYTIAVYGADGQITKYDVVVGEDVVDELDVVTEATGTTFVDLTEIEESVTKIEITASTDAEVVFYVTAANVATKPIA